MNWKKILRGIAVIFIVQTTLQLTGCGSDDPEPVVSQVTTSTISSITETSASSGGTIISDGGGPVTAAGVCWGTSSSPTISGNKTSDVVAGESFTSIISGLSPGTTYFVRAYATNSAGTSYGNEISFSTLVGLPQLTTSVVSELTATSAKSGGTITSNGGATISEAGICWSTNPQPTIGDTKITAGVASGSFVSAISGLSPGVMYYIRAYATNNVGTAYGNQISFTTLQPVTDFNGNVYDVVRIGNQTWMAENLKSTHYADGTAITGVYAYDDNEDNANTYGRLYTWSALMRDAASSNAVPSGVQGACPNGYHVPSSAEWEILINFLGGSNIAGGKMKATGTLQNSTGLWFSPNTGATNSSGFTGLPGGWREANGSYNVKDFTGFWWSSYRQSIFNDIVTLGHEIASVNLSGTGNDVVNSDAYSVRCIQN